MKGKKVFITASLMKIKNYTTQAVDADIGPVNDEEPFAEVQLTALHNILANEQQHTEQSEPSYDTHLLETIDSNTTPTSTNMCHRGGEIDQDALLKTELLKTKDMVDKEIYNELSKRFLQLEKHCISLEIQIQQKEESFQSNKPCKNQEFPEFREFFVINDLKAQLLARTTLICNLKKQIKSVKETSNEAKVKNNIDVIETINIELEHSVAKLLAANEQLHKENEHLKQTYKELYDSIKKTRIQNKDNSESLISQINQKSVENADLKAQIQEKVFANAALNNELRKLKGNIVDSKFTKASILGKPPLQPSRNHLVVRQPNAFTSERPRISRPRFASQVDEKNDLSKTVTPHYLPKVRESAAAKPHQVNAPNYSRNSHKESYGSNDMVHAYFLENDRKMTQDKTRIPNHRDMASTIAHCTPNACTPKPRNIYRSSPVSKCSGGMSNGVPLVDHSRNSSFFLDSKEFSVENADLKAQISEKVFANAALNNELRKLKGNIVDSKFTKASILGKPPLQPSRNHLVVRQPNAFTSERPRISRPRFASQVDEKNDLSKTVTPHYLPKVRESAAAKPHQVTAPNYSRNSHKESYGSNDMVHAYFLENDRKMTQDKTRIPNHRDMASTIAHCTQCLCGGMSNGVPLVDHSRNSSFFLDSKEFVNSRAKVQSLKIRNNNPVEPKNHTHKPGRQIGIGQRIFKTVSLRWIPTGKVFIDSTTKVDSEPPNGSNDDITNPYECQSNSFISAGNCLTQVQEFKEFKSDEHASKDVCSHQFSGLVLHLDVVWTKQFKPRSSSKDCLYKPVQTSDSNVEYLRANLNIKGMSNSRRTSLSNVDYRLYPSLLRTVTDWKGKPSLRSTERSLLHDNIVPKPDLALELGKSISLNEAEEEDIAREVHATNARIVSGPDPEPMQEDQTGSNSGKLHVSLAGPNPEHMDDEFLATAYPKVHENLKLITDERVIEENPESHSGSMSSMKNLDDTYNFGDQFLYDKPTEDDQEKSKVIEESDSTIPDPSHQTVTSTPPVIAPFTDVSSTKPSSLVTPPPINTEATTITTSLPEITPFIALQLRVARLEQEMSEVKKTDHSADVLASIKSQVPTAVDKYLGTKLDDALLKILERHTADLIEKYSVLPGPESVKNQESEKSPKEIIRSYNNHPISPRDHSIHRTSAKNLIEKYSVLPGLESIQNHESEKSPKEIIRIKREQGEEKQDSTYSIRSTDKVDLEEFDLKSALFKHMNKNKSANRNPANYHLYHALMEALIADEDAMDKEVKDRVKNHKRKHDSDDDDEDDDDDEGPSAGSNQAIPSTGWDDHDTRDADVDSSMHRSDPESE
ncbi:hypothetical protein Tco_0704871 [Tanacetum coccineum]|uniref:Uncharacterized protein n=1 Tax=Tanacetum coccineum TaxID=301880 RepID=A0ABQ4Y2Y2_9ASTR